MGVPFTDKLFQQAQQHHQSGQLAEAERLYRKLLESQPNHAGAIHYLGLIAYQVGQPAEAARLIQHSIALEPRRGEYFNNLGQVLRALGKTDEALAAFQHAVALNPKLANAYNNVGMILIDRKQWAEAIPWAEKCLGSQGNHIGAMSVLAQGLAETGRVDDAKKVWRRVLEIAPNEPTATFMLASLEGTKAPPVAPASTTVQLFDEYASYFDKHLESLGYRVPQIIAETINRLDPQRSLDIMDLGCGTGLVGAAMRERIRSIVGVDLSGAMLEQARRRGIYSTLERGDVTAALRSRQEAFDLIVAAEVFVYIGDLAELFTAAAKALRPGGLFTFSIESHAGSGYVLQRSRRYAHAMDYIRSLATEHRFTIVETQDVPLRKGEGSVISGAMVVLKKS